MRRAIVSAIVVACSCAIVFARGGGAPGGAAHFHYRMGPAPRSEFKVGGRTFAISPDARSTKAIRGLKSEEFDPTMRSHRAEIFYRTKFKDHYDDWHHHFGHDIGPFRAEFVEWARHWPVAMRARWAWHNRDYIDGPAWSEWMADPAFAAVVDTLQRNNVVSEAGYLPSDYAKVSPLFIYNDEYLNAAFNPVPVLAVLKLKSLKPDEKTDWIGAAAADSLVSKLSSVPGLFLAEREQVSGAIRDKKLNEVEAAEPEAAAKVGKALDVEQVVVGSYVADGDEVLFNLRVVDVQTGAVRQGISRAVARDHLLTEMPTLGSSLADALGFKIVPPAASGSPTTVVELKHFIDGHFKETLRLLPDGHINKPDSAATWTFDGRTLSMRWPGGGFVDRCEIAQDGKTLDGRNNEGHRIHEQVMSGSFDSIRMQ